MSGLAGHNLRTIIRTFLLECWRHRQKRYKSFHMNKGEFSMTTSRSRKWDKASIRINLEEHLIVPPRIYDKFMLIIILLNDQKGPINGLKIKKNKKSPPKYFLDVLLKRSNKKFTKIFEFIDLFLNNIF